MVIELSVNSGLAIDGVYMYAQDTQQASHVHWDIQTNQSHLIPYFPCTIGSNALAGLQATYVVESMPMMRQIYGVGVDHRVSKIRVFLII